MASKATVVGQVAEEYCRKYADKPSRTIARILRAEQPKLFKSIDDARNHVRYVRGASGHRCRSQIKPDRLVERITIPEPEPPTFGIDELPDGRNWLVICDPHCPYHDAKALDAAIKTGRERECDGVLLLGDFIDCYQLSDFCRDPRRRNFAGEVQKAKQLIDYIRQELNPREFIWKLGNHEDRYRRFMLHRCPEFLGVPEFEFASVFGLAERKVKLVESVHLLRQGHLVLLHGHEWGSAISSPVNQARGAFLRTVECTISGHGHRTSHHVETALLGRTISSWSIGCLSDLHPDYRPVNRFNQGFAILDATKDWRVTNYRIDNGVVM